MQEVLSVLKLVGIGYVAMALITGFLLSFLMEKPKQFARVIWCSVFWPQMYYVCIKGVTPRELIQG